MIDLNFSDRVATIALRRPPVNAFDEEQLQRFTATLERIRASDAAVVLVRAEGPHFATGADIKAVTRTLEFSDGAQRMAAFAAGMQGAWDELAGLEMPTVAAIHGAATGGGLELALACDVRIAADTARLGLPEVRLGVLPAAGGTQRLTRLAGAGNASLLMLTGELVDAATALRLGIVQRVVAADELAMAARDLVATVAANSDEALKAIKRCIGMASNGDDGFAAEIAASAHLYTTDEAVGRMRAFALRND